MTKLNPWASLGPHLLNAADLAFHTLGTPTIKISSRVQVDAGDTPRPWHARFTVDGPDAVLVLRNLQFNNMQNPTSYGGAIELGSASQSGSVQLFGCSFDNIVSNRGGSISLCGGTLDVQSSTFSHGSAIDSNVGFGGQIRAGYATNGRATCTDHPGMTPSCASLIANPSVIAAGGCDLDISQLTQNQNDFGQHLRDPGWCPAECGNPCCPESTVTLRSTEFLDSSATKTGGAVYVYGQLSIDDCTFRNNHADVGGAVFVEGVLSVANSRFSANTALQGHGQAIMWLNAPANMLSGHRCATGATAADDTAACWCASRRIFAPATAPGRQPSSASLEPHCLCGRREDNGRGLDIQE